MNGKKQAERGEKERARAQFVNERERERERHIEKGKQRKAQSICSVLRSVLLSVHCFSADK